MIESRNDFILRILDEIAFLTARLAGLKAMGMSEEIQREVEKLDQAVGQLDEADRPGVAAALDALKKSLV